MADHGSEDREGPVYCPEFSAVRTEELRAITARWKAQQLGAVDEKALTGIAISGGGIRSASFSLGAIQKLAHEGRLKDVHYLSTVSGGGYTGCSLTWYLSRTHGGKPCYGTMPDRFPFLGGEAAANRRLYRHSPDAAQADPAPPDGRTIVDFIRQRSSYLVPGRGLGMLSALGIVLRSMFTSLFAYFLMFTLLWLLLQAVAIGAWSAAGLHYAFWAAIGLLACIPGSAILYSLVSPWPGLEKISYRLRRHYQEWIGAWLGWAIGCALFGLWLILIPFWADGDWLIFDLPGPASAASATLGGALLGFLAKKLAAVAPRFLGWLLPLLPPLALFLLLSGLGALGHRAAHVLTGEPLTLAGWTIVIGEGWMIALIVAAIAYLLYANINLTGLHRFYRDRLMEAFMPDLADVRADEPSSPTDANKAELWALFDPACSGPYQLINANVVMLDSAHARYRSRRSDSFVLAPLYCGGEATGWARSDRWPTECGAGTLIREAGPMTIATAMAISGAAVNPNTGADGRGVTKTAALSAILTILNIRLGYWAASPRQLDPARRRTVRHPPNFLFPGFIKGIFGFGRTERSKWLELTDGGHFDNIGLYELVRRRLKTIYVIDGTEDHETRFSSFANAAEKIYIDFNVRLKFPGDTDFIKLMRGADLADNPLSRAYQLAERGFAVGTMEYPPLFDAHGTEVESGFTGTLYYLKATLTKGLPEALYSYRADNPLFPSQSTADQFFDEQQFEAYRTLGFVLAGQLTRYLGKAGPGPPVSGPQVRPS